MKIRNIAICYIEWKDHLFVLEGHDPVKNQTFYRPLGGGIEFGELANEAAMREFQEELETEIEVIDSFQVFENIFEYNGKPGHEVVFVLTAKFNNSEFYQFKEFVGNESGTPFKALWVPMSDFMNGKKILYPEGLSSFFKQPSSC